MVVDIVGVSADAKSWTYEKRLTSSSHRDDHGGGGRRKKHQESVKQALGITLVLVLPQPSISCLGAVSPFQSQSQLPCFSALRQRSIAIPSMTS